MDTGPGKGFIAKAMMKSKGKMKNKAKGKVSNFKAFLEKNKDK